MFSVLAVLSLLLLSAVALPTFDDFGRRSNSLIPDPTRVRVFARHDNAIVPHDVTLVDPDYPGHLTVIPDALLPMSFHIYRNRLWVYRNGSAIWPVNFVNTTQMSGYPLQTVVGTKTGGVNQGLWSWRDTELHYDHGARWHTFYVCPTPNGYKGVFLFTTPSASAECDVVTFSRHG
ncbi:hypothetical protein JOM56_008596 [Amanita muscaria]